MFFSLKPTSPKAEQHRTQSPAQQLVYNISLILIYPTIPSETATTPLHQKLDYDSVLILFEPQGSPLIVIVVTNVVFCCCAR